MSWVKEKSDHLLFRRSSSITPGEFPSRSKVSLSPHGQVELVAKWADGVPMIAIRHDMKGLITSFGFGVGRPLSQDGIDVVVNALNLFKKSG